MVDIHKPINGWGQPTNTSAHMHIYHVRTEADIHTHKHTHNSKKSKLFQMVLYKLYKEQRTGTGEMA